MYKHEIERIIEKLGAERKLSYDDQRYIAELLVEARNKAEERFLPENGTVWLHSPAGGAKIYFVQDGKASDRVDDAGNVVGGQSVDGFAGVWSYQRTRRV